MKILNAKSFSNYLDLSLFVKRCKLKKRHIQQIYEHGNYLTLWYWTKK